MADCQPAKHRPSWKGPALPSTDNDDFSRLREAIEDWDSQITQSHAVLSAEIGVARGHLDRLLQMAPESGAADGGDPPPPDEEREALVARLEEEVARLTAELEATRSAAAGDEEARRGLEAVLERAESECAARDAAARALEEELRAARAEIEALSEQLDAARAPEAAPANEDEVATLRSTIELLQLEHAEARDEIRALKQSRYSGGPPAGVTTGPIDAFDGRGHKKRMGEILVELGVLTEVQLKSILKEQASDPQQRLGALVIAHGYTGEDLVARILAAQLRLPYQDLSETEPEPRAVGKVGAHVVRLHRCMPIREESGVLSVAMVNPLDLIAIEDVELASGCRVAPVVATRAQIDALIDTHYPEAAG